MNGETGKKIKKNVGTEIKCHFLPNCNGGMSVLN